MDIGLNPLLQDAGIVCLFKEKERQTEVDQDMAVLLKRSFLKLRCKRR